MIWVDEPVADPEKKFFHGLTQVVLSLGARPNDALIRKPVGKVPELYVIGDRCRVGKIMEAAYDGFRVARLI